MKTVAVAGLAIVAFLLLVNSAWWYFVVHIHGMQASRRLGPCAGKQVSFSTELPPGSRYSLAIGQDPPARSMLITTGIFPSQIAVSGAGRRYEWESTTWKAHQSDWLRKEGVEDCLNLGRLSGTSGQKLRSGEQYQITVTFAQKPPPKTSLWLFWTTDEGGP